MERRVTAWSVVRGLCRTRWRGGGGDGEYRGSDTYAAMGLPDTENAPRQSLGIWEMRPRRVRSRGWRRRRRTNGQGEPPGGREWAG